MFAGSRKMFSTCVFKSVLGPFDPLLTGAYVGIIKAWWYLKDIWLNDEFNNSKLQLTGLELDFKDVGVLNSMNPFEPDTPIEEPVRVGLPTYNVNQGPCKV